MGLCLTGLQLAAVLAAAPRSRAGGWHLNWHALVQHDSFWFENIVQRGYASPVPPVNYKAFQISNVAFFPGYPVAADGVARLLRISPRNALLLTAELGAWAFWSYATAFLFQWRVPVGLAGAGLAVIAAHPAAMFLVAAYSESLFLAGLLGFLYWSARPGAAAAMLAGLHGFGMTATRIAGIPCVAAGLLRRRASLMVAFFSLLGAASFFAFCQARFGHWDFYMQTQAAGWGVEPHYLAPFQWEIYRRFAPHWDHPRRFSQFSVTATFWIMVAMALGEVWRLRRGGNRAGWRVRLPFYFCALAIFYVSVVGVASVRFQSMIRYQFCIHVLLVLAGVHWLAEGMPQGGRARRLWVSAVALGCLLFLAFGWFVQAHYAREFTRGGWFA